METDNCRFCVHEFSSPLQNILVHFYVIKLKDSYFLWIGSSPAKFSNLSVALSTKYVSLGHYPTLARRVLYLSSSVHHIY